MVKLLFMKLRNAQRRLIACCIFLFTLTATYAQDNSLLESLKIPFLPEGAKVSINQVETTDFPRVKLYTSVTRGGMPLTGLTADNFRVRENNTDQGPIKVMVERDQISAVVLLDVSGSMKGSIEATKQAAIGFLKTLRKGDKVQIITFHEWVETIFPLGDDFAAAERAINQIRHRGDTALYDGIWSAVTAIRDIPGRRAVIVLSDGVDDDGYGNQLSKRGLDEPLMLGIQTNIPIYTIGLGSKMDAGILKTFAGTTGAEYVNAPTKEELDELYAKIGQKLSSQYAIEYTTSRPLEGGLREVKLDYVVPSRKPYAAPDPVFDEAGRVISYKAPELSDQEMGRLARMAGVDEYAKLNQIQPLEKFIKEIPVEWPEEIPAYDAATDVKREDKENKKGFSFKAPEKAEDFIKSYKGLLNEDDWQIFNQSNAGNLAFIKAYRGEAELTIGVLGQDDSSQVNIEYRLPKAQPIVIDQNNANQIVEANGRDVIITGADGVFIISGGCGKLSLSGGQNQVQVDTVNSLEILGDKNTIILTTLGESTISGNENEVAWSEGIDDQEPKIETSGEGNRITKLE